MTATVTGWGTLVSDGPTPNVLQKVKYFYAYVNILTLQEGASGMDIE